MGSLFSAHYQEYYLCILFRLVLPILPILFELWIIGSISSKSLMLTTAMYAISIGNASQYKLMFGLTIIIGIIFSMCFGIVASGSIPLLHSEICAKISIVFIFLIASVEKYTMHVTDRIPFWNFR
jgi:hypothetical protein